MKALVFKIPVVENCSVYVQEDRLPHFYDHLHLHPEIQLTCILKGQGTLFGGNYMGRFGPGDIYWIASNQPHLFKCDPAYFKQATAAAERTPADTRTREEARGQEAHSLSIYFRPSGTLQQLFCLPELSEIAGFIARNNGIYQFESIPARIPDNLFREVSEAVGSRRIVSFLELLGLLARQADRKILCEEGARVLNEQECIRMNTVYQFTMQHFPEKISLDRIAALAHMTPQAFCRYFRRSTRKTYMRFLNEVRVNHARKLICEGDDIALSHVAAACGFENASGFSRTFRRFTGLSPLAYRKQFTLVNQQ